MKKLLIVKNYNKFNKLKLMSSKMFFVWFSISIARIRDLQDYWRAGGQALPILARWGFAMTRAYY